MLRSGSPGGCIHPSRSRDAAISSLPARGVQRGVGSSQMPACPSPSGALSLNQELPGNPWPRRPRCPGVGCTWVDGCTSALWIPAPELGCL